MKIPYYTNPVPLVYSEIGGSTSALMCVHRAQFYPRTSLWTEVIAVGQHIYHIVFVFFATVGYIACRCDREFLHCY